MKYVSLMDFAFCYVWLIWGLAILAIYLYSWWKYRSAYPKDERDLFTYATKHPTLLAIVICIISLSLIVFFSQIVGTSIALIDNRLTEPEKYESMIAQKEAYLPFADDPDLVDEITDYNKALAAIKSHYNNPMYKINFSGDYDWNSLTPIEPIK